MAKYESAVYKAWTKFSNFISDIHWTKQLGKIRGTGRGYNLTDDDHAQLKELLSDNYYLILTNRKTHLTTYGIGAMTMIKTGKWPKYAHALMNLDLVTNPENFKEFRILESTKNGVHFSHFMDVFDCDSVCVLEPVNMDHEEWNDVMLSLTLQVGKQYDLWFDIKDNTRVSCVEMCLDALRGSPNYMDDFPNLEAMIRKVNNLTPQMFYDCPDFRVVFEVRR